VARGLLDTRRKEVVTHLELVLSWAADVKTRLEEKGFPDDSFGSNPQRDSVTGIVGDKASP
jgi:hypothetical protein